MHYEVECRIVIFYSAQSLFHLYLYCQFLTYLTYESRLTTLTWLDLTTWKFPPIFPFAISSLSGIYKPITLNDGRHYFYMLHRCLII